MAESGKQPLSILISEVLHSIEFGSSFVLFRFGQDHSYLLLETFAFPEVEKDGGKYKQGDTGYRDGLCGAIDKRVVDAQVSEGRQIQVRFEDGTMILISLLHEGPSGTEAVNFSNDQQMWIW